MGPAARQLAETKAKEFAEEKRKEAQAAAGHA
jgi:hypothetical protein